MPDLPAPMLAQLDAHLPVGERWRYEPKLDGFRGLLWRPSEGHQTRLLSRNGRDLGPWFPELAQAGRALPTGSILDGEIVICDAAGWSDFGSLQERLSTARTRVTALVAERPAVLVAFDLLALGGSDLTQLPFRDRRNELERLLEMRHPCLQLVAQTTDVDLAKDWLKLASIEGVVAKRVDRPYSRGRGRDWVKVKHQRTVDCVVIGVAGEASAPKLVLALRHDDGRLHHFAVTRPLAPEVSTPIRTMLGEAGEEAPAIRSRWQHDAIPPWRPVPPRLICEVRVSNLDAGRWARFPAAFVRWRSDRSPDDCGLDQLAT